MPSDVVLLAVTAVLAVVAVVAAVIATRASRQVVRARQEPQAPAVPESRDEPATPAPAPVARVPERPAELAPRVVEGRVVVPPTREEVVSTALSRPQVRFTVLVHGLVTALRPESRDRIAALMRREYRERRRFRLRAGRRAARAAHMTPTPAADQWLGELGPARPGAVAPSVESDVADPGRAIGA